MSDAAASGARRVPYKAKKPMRKDGEPLVRWDGSEVEDTWFNRLRYRYWRLTVRLGSVVYPLRRIYLRWKYGLPPW